MIVTINREPPKPVLRSVIVEFTPAEVVEVAMAYSNLLQTPVSHTFVRLLEDFRKCLL